MSGGYFDHNQWRLEDIASQIDELILSNEDSTLNEWGEPRGRFYSQQTIAKFRQAANTLRLAAAMAQRVDWLVSGDDGEETFHKRWDEEISKYS